MTDAEKLRWYAYWLDKKYSKDLNPEVQMDLRRIADYIEEMRDEEESVSH